MTWVGAPRVGGGGWSFAIARLGHTESSRSPSAWSNRLVGGGAPQRPNWTLDEGAFMTAITDLKAARGDRATRVGGRRPRLRAPRVVLLTVAITGGVF